MPGIYRSPRSGVLDTCFGKTSVDLETSGHWSVALMVSSSSDRLFFGLEQDIFHSFHLARHSGIRLRSKGIVDSELWERT